jgi:hypothetical protein
MTHHQRPAEPNSFTYRSFPVIVMKLDNVVGRTEFNIEKNETTHPSRHFSTAIFK